MQSISSEHLEHGTKCHNCGKPAKWVVNEDRPFNERVYYCGNCASKGEN